MTNFKISKSNLGAASEEAPHEDPVGASRGAFPAAESRKSPLTTGSIWRELD